MKNARHWSKPLLWLHLFVCVVWLYLFHTTQEPPNWAVHIFVLSILGVQFTWGFTIGLIVGPARKERDRLWWSLLLIFMPLYIAGPLLRFLLELEGPLVAFIYFVVFVCVLACETFGGVLLGAKMHHEGEES